MHELNSDEPFFQISQVAKLIGVTSDRLRTYEEEGLIKPYRKSTSGTGKRLFSQNDIEYLQTIRELIKLGVCIPAIRVLIKSKLPANTSFCTEKEHQIINLVKKIQKNKIAF